MPYRDKEKNDEAKRRWKRNNPEKVKLDGARRYANNRELWYEYELKRNYGVTLEQYKYKLAEQNGVCAICGGLNKNGWRLCLDHNHATNLPRGILCRKCNSILGLVNDSIETLESAIAYLREYENV